MKNNKETRIRLELSTVEGWELSNEEISIKVGCSEVYVATMRRKVGPPDSSIITQLEEVLLQASQLTTNRELFAQALDHLGLLEQSIAMIGERRINQILGRINESKSWRNRFEKEDLADAPILGRGKQNGE